MAVKGGDAQFENDPYCKKLAERSGVFDEQGNPLTPVFTGKHASHPEFIPVAVLYELRSDAKNNEPSK